MTGLKRFHYFGALALLGGLFGCTPTTPRSIHSNLLPPVPKTRPEPPPPPKESNDPPAVTVRLELADSPRFMTAPFSERNTRITVLIREADWHMQSGRKLYREGDEGGARREFDRAIDVLLSAPEDADARAAVDKKIDELIGEINRFDLAGLGAGDVSSEPKFDKPPLEDLPQLTFPVDPNLKSKVVDELRATASQLPLEVNDAILSYIHFFRTERGRRTLIAGLRRAGRYRPLIQRVFDEEGVPQELIFMAQAESGFLPRAVSRKRATGMWQFMRLRGRQYELYQSPYADDRLDPEKATRAAARHLHDLYNRYGDWYLAMAAYNCGPGNVDRAVERTGYADFWELRRLNVLPKETTNYVPVILAMTIMVKNAKEYGLEGVEADPALEYDTLELSAPTHLQLIADLAECPVSQLHDLNPALLKNLAPAGTALRIPKGSLSVVTPLLALIPPEKRACWRAHRVLDGETLHAIGQRYKVTPGSIMAVNRAQADAFETGDLLLIPAAPERPKPVVRRAGARRTVHSRSTARSTVATKRPAARSAQPGTPSTTATRLAERHTRPASASR